MALNPKRSSLAANAAVDAMAALLANGYLRIYGGAQPATADTALSGQTLLAELRFAAVPFAPAANGVATAAALVADASANASGTATWFRALRSDGASVVYDGSVGVAAADLVLTSTAVVATSPVAVTALTLTEGK